MNAEPEGLGGEAAANPADAADADQHAIQEIAGMRARLAVRWPRALTSLAAAAAGMVSGWLILIRRRRLHGRR